MLCIACIQICFEYRVEHMSGWNIQNYEHLHFGKTNWECCDCFHWPKFHLSPSGLYKCHKTHTPKANVLQENHIRTNVAQHVLYKRATIHCLTTYFITLHNFLNVCAPICHFQMLGSLAWLPVFSWTQKFDLNVSFYLLLLTLASQQHSNSIWFLIEVRTVISAGTLSHTCHVEVL